MNDLIKINKTIEYGYNKLHHDPALSFQQNHDVVMHTIKN